jgi:uncharacterized lipoprotein YmbA
MNISRRISLFAGASMLTAVLTSCRSPPARYYRLAPVPSTSLVGAPRIVSVLSVTIPAYLNQDGIAKLDGGYRFSSYSNDLWAEPLSDMLQTVMVQNLEQRLTGATVIASGGSIGVPSDARVEINVLKFDSGNDGRVSLIAQIAVKLRSNRTEWQTQTFSRSKSPAGPSVSDIVAVMSTLWAEAADVAARLVVQTPQAG